jgi:gp16 family phage-associated protein
MKHDGAQMTTTVESFRRTLEANGLSIADWSRQHGFNVRTVYAVLRGELKAKRGVGHRIAVAAGLKPQPKKAA